MKTVRTVAELRAALSPPRGEGLTIGLVPTMGALHEGHLALIRRAREECDIVAVSIFVNPAQFNERKDLERYPRAEADDAALAAAAGVDLVFAPSVEEVYPAGFATAVEVIGITDRLEGASRGSGHFRGVTTVVTKLLCMAMPHVAYFGQKDAQQTVVVRRLAEDLNLPVRIEVCPTVREPDGLAMASRNRLLDPDQRDRARSLYEGLQAARVLAAGGEHSVEVLIEAATQTMRSAGVAVEYVALVGPDSLEPLERLTGNGLLAVAGRIGDVRLIDNVILEPAAASSSSQKALQGEAIATCNV